MGIQHNIINMFVAIVLLSLVSVTLSAPQPDVEVESERCFSMILANCRPKRAAPQPDAEVESERCVSPANCRPPPNRAAPVEEAITRDNNAHHRLIRSTEVESARCIFGNCCRPGQPQPCM